MEQTPDPVRALEAALQRKQPKPKPGLPTNRAARRRAQANGHNPQASGRAPGKTGSRTHWVADIKRARALQDAMRALPTAGMVPECPELKLLAPHFPNAWVLATAAIEHLLETPGIGRAKLRKIRAYLSTKNVPCKWRVD